MNAEVQEVDPESLRKALQKRKERMMSRIPSRKPPALETDDVENDERVVKTATPKRKSEKVEEIDSSSEYTIDSEIEIDEEVKTPEENEKDLKALREEKSQDLTKKDEGEDERPPLERKKREEKESLQRKPQPVGFTPGAVANFTQALVMQKLEEIKSIDGTLVLLERDHPARKALEETVTQKKEEIKKIQAERRKARDRKHSVRQEMDKKEAGSRAAYIKERQRKKLLSTGSLVLRQELLPMWQGKRKLRNASTNWTLGESSSCAFE